MKAFEKKIIDSHNNKSDLLFERVTGSRLYGTNYELGEHPFWEDYVSDWDYRGVFAINPDIKIMMPPFNKYDSHVKLEDMDAEYYELEKFFIESKKNNPNYMDLLFANRNSLLGSSKAGDLILENKDLFISNKIADSFNGFAQSQLNRIKGHKAWLDKFPEIYIVEDLLLKAYINDDISPEDIAFNFSSKIRDKIKMDSDFYKPKNINITFEEMISKYFKDVNFDVYKYMKPYVLDFITLYTLEGQKISNQEKENYKTFLEESASFKKKNESLYFIYENGKGIFSSNRSIHTSLPKKINPNNNVKLILTVDYHNFKSKKANIDSLWEWKAKRNGRRADLEKRFGYDVKHAMHTYRLLDGAIETYENGTYTPELEGDRLKEAFEVLNGKFEYKEIINIADIKIQKLRKLKNKKIFQEEPDNKKLNELYMEVLNITRK